MKRLLDWWDNIGCFFACCLIVVLLCIGLCGLTLPSGCDKDCKSQPVHFLFIPLPGTNYATFYNVSSNGKPLPPVEEEPHVSSSSHPVEEAPIEVPHVSVAE
jgi:hypothetical protein